MGYDLYDDFVNVQNYTSNFSSTSNSPLFESKSSPNINLESELEEQTKGSVLVNHDNTNLFTELPYHYEF